jgi:hypothetical protein
VGVCLEAFSANYLIELPESKKNNAMNRFRSSCMSEESVSLVEKIKKTSARWNPLRKVDTLGQFDFNTCVVMLDSLQFSSVRGITLADLQSVEKFDLATCERLTKALVLAVHEYTHFVDSTSTLWGLRHLRMMHRAYTCNVGDENKFHVMKAHYTHLKRLKFPDYYTTVSKQFNTDRPWQWKLTTGREFRPDGKPGERPILFVRFFNEKWEPIIRSPISTISLLETGAMAAEMRVASSLLRRIEDDNERIVATKLFEDESFEYLYNPKLTEYSVCAHLVANRFNISEATQAFWGSSIIARVALNTSTTVYNTILKNVLVFFDKVGLRYSEPEAKAIRRALGNYDSGALFYVLCMMMDNEALESSAKFAVSLVVTMAKFGVHFERDYEKTALQEAETIVAELKGSAFVTIANVANAGFENLSTMIGGFGTLHLDEMNLPPVLLGDNTEYEFHAVASNKLRGLAVEESYFEMSDGQERMQEFGDACL